MTPHSGLPYRIRPRRADLTPIFNRQPWRGVPGLAVGAVLWQAAGEKHGSLRGFCGEIQLVGVSYNPKSRKHTCVMQTNTIQ